MSSKFWLFVAVITILFCVLGYGVFIIYVSWPIKLGNVDKAGAFGDSFGIFTSLFSGLAFVGIVFTILLQKEELGLQRKELTLTRNEMKNQVSATKSMSFENTFFQMLRLHNDIVNEVDLRVKGIVSTSGRDCFTVFYSRLRDLYTYEKDIDPNRSEPELLELAYTKFWDKNQSDLGHYFRYLYTIFKFVKESEISDKRLYTNIVRAQLSHQELLMLFYNCLNKFGVEKFKPLAEEFDIFNNLPVTILLARKHKDLFEPEAFG